MKTTAAKTVTVVKAMKTITVVADATGTVGIGHHVVDAGTMLAAVRALFPAAAELSPITLSVVAVVGPDGRTLAKITKS